MDKIKYEMFLNRMKELNFEEKELKEKDLPLEEFYLKKNEFSKNFVEEIVKEDDDSFYLSYDDHGDFYYDKIRVRLPEKSGTSYSDFVILPPTLDVDDETYISFLSKFDSIEDYYGEEDFTKDSFKYLSRRFKEYNIFSNLRSKNEEDRLHGQEEITKVVRNIIDEFKKNNGYDKNGIFKSLESLEDAYDVDFKIDEDLKAFNMIIYYGSKKHSIPISDKVIKEFVEFFIQDRYEIIQEKNRLKEDLFKKILQGEIPKHDTYQEINENYVFHIKDEIYDFNPKYNEEVKEFFNKNKEEIIRNYVLNKIKQDDFPMPLVLGERYSRHYYNNEEDIFSCLYSGDFKFIFGDHDDLLDFYISDKGAITINSYERKYYNDYPDKSYRVLVEKQNIEIPELKDLQNTLVKKEISNYIEKKKTFIVKEISNKIFSNSRDTTSLEQKLEKQLVKHFNRTVYSRGGDWSENFMITSVKDNNIILENGDKIDVSDIMQEISQQINDYINDLRVVPINESEFKKTRLESTINSREADSNLFISFNNWMFDDSNSVCIKNLPNFVYDKLESLVLQMKEPCYVVDNKGRILSDVKENWIQGNYYRDNYFGRVFTPNNETITTETYDNGAGATFSQDNFGEIDKYYGRSQEMKEKYPKLSNNKSQPTDRQGDEIKKVAKQNTYWIDLRLH